MKPLITDTQTLKGAKSRFGTPIPVYDDGFGPLFIHRDSMGISGIVRAQTWEDAYSICEDEFFPEASETVEEMEKDYSTIYLSGRELWERENPDKAFHLLSDSEKNEIFQAGGKDVPFEGEFTEHPCWQEAFVFRPNGQRSGNWENGTPRDPIGHGIYAKDLNGDALDLLTPELLAELEITLEIEGEEAQ